MAVDAADMIIRSYDPEKFIKATECYREHVPLDMIKPWLENHRNIMYISGDNVGLLTAEYPGLYNGHWFFTDKGKKAIDLAFEMFADLFQNHGAKVVQGITPIELRGARYLAKKIGFVSQGFVESVNGTEELMTLTKDDFLRKQKERYGS